jgi:exonuclease SbcC
MKFKRVEIQAFKSYLDKRSGTFDFTVESGEPADIVSIYAPNGFGKTSFYDAVDFCMTNNITRFIRDKSLANINNLDAKSLNSDGEKQYILRTSDAPSNIESVIKVVTDENVFVRKVALARTGSKDYTFDDSKTKPEERYFRSVMLSQEAIDGFLRELKPEIRYERFMEQQLGGDNSFEENRKYIQSMLVEINQRLSKLSDKCKVIDEKNQLIELGGDEDFDSSSLVTINELIDDLNNQGQEIPNVDNTFDRWQKERLVLDCWQVEETSKNKLNFLENEKEVIIGLLNGLVVHESNHLNLIKYENEVRTLTKMLTGIKTYDRLIKRNRKLKAKLNSYNATVVELQKRRVDLSDYIEKVNIRNNIVVKISKINDEIKENEGLLSGNIVVVTGLENQLKILADKKAKFKELQVDAVEIYFKITEFEEVIRYKDITGVKDKESKLTKRIGDITSKGVLLKSLNVEDFDLMLSGDFKDERFVSIASKYSEELIKHKKLRENYNDVCALIDSAKQQEGSISELIELGSKLINKNKDYHCPLCQNEYDSFEVLADLINSNSSLSVNKQRLLKKLEGSQFELNNQHEYLKTLKASFDDEKEKCLVILRVQVKDGNNEKNNLIRFLDVATKEQAELDKLRLLTSYKTLDAFLPYLNDEISACLGEIDILELKIKRVENERVSLIDTKQSNSVKLTLLTNSECIDDEFIAEYSKFLFELDVIDNPAQLGLGEDEILALIIGRLEIEGGRVNEKQREIAVVNDEIEIITDLHGDIFTDNSLVEMQGIDENILSINESISKLNIENSTFKIIVNKLDLSYFVKIGDWNSIRIKFELSISTYQETINEIAKLISGVDFLKVIAEKVLSYVEYVRSVDEIREYNLEIHRCEHVKSQLLTDLSIVNESLKFQVDDYFYVDLINTIYKKIDPHPDFKRIVFKCEFPEEGKPKLHVYVDDGNDLNLISPTLNFSSAQINVLSLSIFLAKALNTKNGENDVNCIFIDDPVQSMDSINVLGVIDLLRGLSLNLGRQIIISTHDENFHALLEQKLPKNLFKSKFLKLESFGKVEAHLGQ